ncbi:hypothetical protein BC835DRAFT_1414166 [Cytidiella melzeri]|nr:hypothetical protein BC835DRAFT_1414166 [Cytidiella melzeri]
MEAKPLFSPPPGSPPATEPPSPQFQPPQGSPPSSLPPTTTAEAADTELPPPYTRKTSDPLPAWSSVEFTDLTDSENPSDLVRLPFDPPPACFSTPTPPRIRSRSFEPFQIPSRGQSLAGGFRLLYPHGQLSPHGISSEDWIRFLQDLGIAARLSSQGLSVRGNVQPQRAGFIRGRMGTAYDASFGKTPVEEVQDLVDVWNESAWERRKVRVTLRTRNDVQARRREAYDLLVEAL